MEVNTTITKTMMVSLLVLGATDTFADGFLQLDVRISHDRATDAYLATRDSQAELGVTALDVRYGGLWQSDSAGTLDVMTRFYLPDSRQEVHHAGLNDDHSSTFAELKRFNYHVSAPVHYGAWQYEMGRKRFRESSGLLWDKDIEGLAIGFHSTLLKAQVRVSEKLVAWRTDQTDFLNEDKEIRYYSGFIDYQWFYQHHISAFILRQDDYSGVQAIGSFHDSEAIDRHDRTASWAGISIARRFESGLTTHVNLQAVKGEGSDSSHRRQGNRRQITGQASYDISGWLVDAGAWLALPQFSSWFGVNVTLTSKGKGAGDRAGFIQSGLASNRYRVDDLGLSFYKTGYAYRQTLENLSMISVRYGTRRDQWRAGIQWNWMQRRNDRAGVGDSQVSTVDGLVPGTHSLGQTLDVEVSWLPENLQFFDPNDRIQLTMRAGLFKAGEAYGQASGEIRSRVRVELKFRPTLEGF